MQGLDRELFVKRLRERKEKTGVTYREISAQTGISQTTIGGYLEGRRIPDLERAFLLARALGVSLGWLCGLDRIKEAKKRAQ